MAGLETILKSQDPKPKTLAGTATGNRRLSVYSGFSDAAAEHDFRALRGSFNFLASRSLCIGLRRSHGRITTPPIAWLPCLF